MLARSLADSRDEYAGHAALRSHRNALGACAVPDDFLASFPGASCRVLLSPPGLIEPKMAPSQFKPMEGDDEIRFVSAAARLSCWRASRARCSAQKRSA